MFCGIAFIIWMADLQSSQSGCDTTTETRYPLHQSFGYIYVSAVIQIEKQVIINILILYLMWYKYKGKFNSNHQSLDTFMYVSCDTNRKINFTHHPDFVIGVIQIQRQVYSTSPIIWIHLSDIIKIERQVIIIIIIIIIWMYPLYIYLHLYTFIYLI